MANNLKDTTEGSLALATSLGILTEEYEYVVKKLGRTPNYAELGIFSAMFSEHCSYKSSKPYLRKFPTEGKQVLQGPGENAGIIDIGEDWAIAFKMESHNHPSFIEPYQGAATGVGGILRDVFTMGARPIASLNALFFGDEKLPKTQSVARGVVKGIGDYGNCIGVPTVGGQTFFHPCYNQNPLVNAFTLGIVKKEGIFKGYASGVGNVVMYVGAKTGRDGVHGASMASQEFSTEEEPDRPTVQVGDPFTEKLLLEATLEMMDKNLVVGIQDMGAAGITSSSFEMAERAQTGIYLELDKIPAREANLSAFELLLSESQERMLLVAEPHNVKAIEAVYEKWDLHAEVVGKVIEGNSVQMDYQGKRVVDLPVSLVAIPFYPDRKLEAPKHLEDLWFLDESQIKQTSIEKKLDLLVKDFNFADPSPITDQYDSMVGNRTEGGTHDDAPVIRLRDIKSANLKLAMSADCNPRVCFLSPREGGRRAVAEAALNLSVRGAKPLGITDCLNFGSPENPEVLWQFNECIEGISEACLALDTPVISGNVSFYNETDGSPIYPTPMIAMAGLMKDMKSLPESSFFETNLEVAVLGPLEAGLGGSQVASLVLNKDSGKPIETPLDETLKTIQCLQKLAKSDFKYSAHDISEGGLAGALMEMAFRGKENLGVTIDVPEGLCADKFLFGEGLNRIVIAFDSSDRSEIESIVNAFNLPFTLLGKTTSEKTLKINHQDKLSELDLAKTFTTWNTKWEGLYQ